MPIYAVRTSPSLHGEAQINTSKNAVLPIMAAALLCHSPVTLHQVPNLTDVDSMAGVLEACGAKVTRTGRDLTVQADHLCSPRDASVMHRLRASILVLGPLCARAGEAEVPLPGGCAIGQRPVDIHLRGMRALGAEANQENNLAIARGRLTGGSIYLDFPSVGATENLIMAAALAQGVTRIENAAKEPEIVDLCDFLIRCGARILGAGTGTVVVDGVSRLNGIEYTPIPDRIEAGTLACAAAITEGSILLSGARSDHLRALLFKLRETGMLVQEDARGLCLRGRAKRGVDVRTLSYPGFPTDLQAPMMTVCCKTKGQSVFLETIFENRYMHAVALSRMGADIRTEGRMAVVRGGAPLYGCTVEATDLRAGAALMLAGLMAQGETQLVDEAGHIDRGYEGLDEKLRQLGADILRSGGTR
ncbi:MAG: UDP-N-acetylglucosamine 1-carboxyvinyltransferase [Clostridia bacterium]|nr:UDP-N-acetylglucosamine 1-carboxyvinyltransferase [Clostridia bacterium]